MKTLNNILFLTLIIFISNVTTAQINEAIKFKITDSNGNTDETIIRLSNEATGQFDPYWDAWKLFTQNDAIPSLYSKTSNAEALTINAIPAITKDTLLELFMRARVVGGVYSMETEQLGDFPADIKIAIKDKVSGVIYELNQNQVFDFNVSANVENDFSRFDVFYSAKPIVEVFENNLSVSNLGSLNWSYEVLTEAQSSVQIGTSNTEILNLNDFVIGNYSIIVTDSHFLVDTVSFSIEYEDVIEEDTTNYENLIGQDLTNSINENLLSSINLIRSDNGYYLDLSELTIFNSLKINTYSLTGKIIDQLVVQSNENVYLNNPLSNSYYIIVIEYEGEVLSFKALSL
jgi:hypothetical protein